MTLIRDVANMSKNIGPADCCFKMAVGFLMKYRDMALLDGSNSNSNGNGNCDSMTINLYAKDKWHQLTTGG